MPPRTLALLVICLIAIMPHPLLTLVFEPLVIAINWPAYPTPQTPFYYSDTQGLCDDQDSPGQRVTYYSSGLYLPG